MSFSDEHHQPVLINETIEYLRPQPGRIYLDGTLGAGGHAEKILVLSQPDGRLIGLDRDESALNIARERLSRFGDRATLVHANFTEAAEVLRRLGVDGVDGVILDLGLSSMQLAQAERGFSFQHPEAPLDMRADLSGQTTAAELIASATETEIADAIYQLADERYSRRIARRIVEERKVAAITTVGQLAKICERAYGGGYHRIHPATRTFMALRMWVNEEVPNLSAVLRQMKDITNPGARVAIISFHSIEDRTVKTFFREEAKAGIWEILTKKPVIATEEEAEQNPRSRSAKLRVVERKTV